LKFTAVAFDLDGTLYPNYRFYVRLIPFILKELRLLWAFGKARTWLRKSDKDSALPACNAESQSLDFYGIQARVMGEFLHEAAETTRERADRLIYRGWEPIFKRVRLFPHVRETLGLFKEKGIKIGLLSDFPPETKLENLNLAGYWDAVVCSELCGHLKPHTAPFIELAGKMGTPPGQILYVGNSVSYDVGGAQKAGMKAALVRSKWRKSPAGDFPDFIFYDYRQLRDYVLS
jgi:putative hydrolase of the HAD superfamily